MPRREQQRVAALLVYVETLEGMESYPTEADFAPSSKTSQDGDEPAAEVPSDADLVSIALADDGALLELIRRDKRYAFTPLAHLRVLEWTALVQRNQHRLPMESTRRAEIDQTAIVASDNLRAFANAICQTGDADRIPLDAFAREFAVVRAKVIAATADSSINDASVAAKHELRIETLRALRRKSRRPAQVDAIVAELAARYGTSTQSIHRHYDRACALGLLRRHKARPSRKPS